MKTNSKKITTIKRPSHQIRIIGGQWKRTVLSVIEAEGLRPTPDRVRETVFNWLNHLLDNTWGNKTCLDLFAGSGALGFEAASRGALQVYMVESHTPAFRQLEQIKEKLQASQCNLIRGDAAKALQVFADKQQMLDVVFLDPPFGQDWLARILPLCSRVMQAKSVLYVEAEFSLAEPVEDENLAKILSEWQVVRADKAGSVFFHILQRNILPHETHENQA